MIGLIRNVTDGIAVNVKRLQKLGVKKVLVNNLHPVGCTPWLSRANNYTVCDARANMAASFHNTYLTESLSKTKNVHILDLNTAFTKIVNHAPRKCSCSYASTHAHTRLHQLTPSDSVRIYAAEGSSKLSKRFEHKLTPCCESFDPEGYCGQLGNNSEKLYSVCTNPEQYFYWDSVHPTQAGWEAVMKQLHKPMLHFLTQNRHH
jgi:phospholipase/lecithinase/hemolysin